MAEAKKTTKAKPKAGAAPASARPATDDAPLGWRTWALLGVVLVGGVIAWKLLGTSYTTDVRTICNAEQLSGHPADKEVSKMSSWLRDHLGTPEGNELFSAVSDAKVVDRAKVLQDGADKARVSPCPLVESCKRIAAEADYRVDVQRLCSAFTFPKLLASDEDTRLQMLEDWIDKTAISPRTKDLADPLRQAAAGPDRAKVLRDAAQKVDVFSCESAKTLETPTPTPLKGDPVVRFYAPPQPIGALQAPDIVKAIQDAQPALVDCYKKGIERKPDLVGHFTAKIEIDASGKVIKDAPGEETTVTDHDTVVCLAHALRGAKFPANAGPLTTALLPLELAHDDTTNGVAPGTDKPSHAEK
ncbi:MAG TPA: AgmX/PglI C-terminal domain-containing protein [Polyangiaceae bacterium]